MNRTENQYQGDDPLPDDYVPPPEQQRKRYGVKSWIFAFVLVFGVIGIVLGAVLGCAFLLPRLPKAEIDLEISIQNSYSISGGVKYYDTDNIRLTVSNDGSEKAMAELITLKISGKNVQSETREWTGFNIPSDGHDTIVTAVTIVDEFAEFTLKISVYYDGEFQDSDSIP